MPATAIAEHVPEAQGNANTQGALADTSSMNTKMLTLSTELAVDFRAACVDQCAELLRTSASLPGPVVPLPKPKIRSLSDVTLKLIGPCIEGQSVNLESLVKNICSDVEKDDDAIHVAVKNMVVQEATRKSYSHDKQAIKRESVLDSTREELLWRWEVKKVSCLAEHKPMALAMRSWMKQAQQCTAVRLHAVRTLQKLTGATVTQKQQAAYEKAQHHAMPGAPPVPCTLQAVVLPTELSLTQDEGMEDDRKLSPSKANAPTKERKSEETKDAIASRAFGSKSSLERSRGVMAMFVQKVPQTRPASPKPTTKTLVSNTEENVEKEIVKLQYIIDGLQNPGGVNVEAHWKHLLKNKWKPMGQKMVQTRVPGLPPAFARKSNAPRDPGQLARLVFGHDNWQGVRTWRRKFLFFPSDGNRPPFYGSFSRRRCKSCSKLVSSRRVLGRDADMDYEVLSDEEWEEEPEGEELDGSDGDDDAGMDEEDDSEGFMVADGYLSEDERADDHGSDVDVWDPAKLKSGLGHGAEPVLHSVVDQPTTSYLNVVLGAKAQGQPVVICRADGPAAAGEGFKARSPEFLQPLQMQCLEMHMEVLPATASLDTTPMENLTALADSAAATSSLQKQVGRFVDSLSDEGARHKSAVIDAVLQKFTTALPRSRIATVVLPAATVYCGSCKRWFSRETMDALAATAKEPKDLAFPLVAAVNSAALQRLTGRCKFPLQLSTQSCSLTAVKAGPPNHGKESASLDTEALLCFGAANTPLVPKKRRLQPTPVDDLPVPSKQVCTDAIARSCAGATPADGSVDGDIRMADVAPSSTIAASVSDMRVAVDYHPIATAAMMSAYEDRATQNGALAAPLPPQPGQGGMDEWMRDNPDRPRLPGGSDDACVNRRDPPTLSPIASARISSHQQPSGAVMTRQPWRHIKTKPQRSPPDDLHESDSGVLIKGAIDRAKPLLERSFGKENEGPGLKGVWPCTSHQRRHVSPVLNSSRSIVEAQGLQVDIPATEFSPRACLHEPSLFSHPIAKVDLTTGPTDDHDDDDAALQAALLASIGAESQHQTPARVSHGHQAPDDSEKRTQCNTSLAAWTLQTLALDPPCTGAGPSARSPPTIAGAVDCSPPAPMAGTAFRKRALFRPNDPMDRVTASKIPDFACYQQKKLRRLSTHLNNCMDSTPDKFTSWRALCTYLAIIPSFRDAATLKVAEPNIRILEFLKPTWKTAAVFEVPVEVLNVCLRACSIRRIEWLQSSALKCVIDIAISVVHRSTKHERLKEVAQRPGCLSLTSLSCNQCLLRAMVQTAADVQSSNSFPQIKFGRQALRVLQAILQSSVGGRVAKHLASLTIKSTGRTALHELVSIKRLQIPKLQDVIDSVLLHAFTRSQEPDPSQLCLPSRMLPEDCTEWYMRQLLQDMTAVMKSGETCNDAADILEALLQAPNCETRGALGQTFMSALASMSTRSTVMKQTISKATVQFKNILRGVFLHQSATCICSRTAPPVFRLCCCLLATDSCHELQKLVIHVFSTPLKNPRERSGPSTYQVVKEAVEFYVNSCADDLVEDRQKAAVVMSSWSPLEQMLSRAMSVSGLYHANQGTLAYRPRPAMLKSDKDDPKPFQQGAARLQGQKRVGAHSSRNKSKGQRMMLSARDA